MKYIVVSKGRISENIKEAPATLPLILLKK